jgi:hypothetical protein
VDLQNQLFRLAENSFPMLIACYLLFRVESRLEKLAESIIRLQQTIQTVVKGSIAND